MGVGMAQQRRFLVSSEFITAFGELLDMQAEVMGSRPTASIAGVAGVDIILETPDTAQTLLADAYSEDGGTWIQCLESPFDGHPITFQAPVIIGDRKLQVMNIPESNHGIYRLQVGDPTRK